VGIAGFEIFKTGIKRNGSIKHMPLPIVDITNALKNATDKITQKHLQKVILDIQNAIAENQSVLTATKKKQTTKGFDSFKTKSICG